MSMEMVSRISLRDQWRPPRIDFTLHVQAAKLGDEAVYYCGAGLTLEHLCSRVDQKMTDIENKLLSISF